MNSGGDFLTPCQQEVTSRRGLSQRPDASTPKTSTASQFIAQKLLPPFDPHVLNDGISSKTSPGLARLRMTPGMLREKQRCLINQHDEIRQKGDQLKSGGGRSLWPEMHRMILTESEVAWLGVQALCLCVLTHHLLDAVHGVTFADLQEFSTELNLFCNNQNSVELTNQTTLQHQVRHWHSGMLSLVDRIQKHFDISRVSANYQLSFVSYLLGLALLLYYLIDNMLAHNYLTPSRIKKWTCLLAVVTTWTANLALGLYRAWQLEWQAVMCVQLYSSALAYLVGTELDLAVYQGVLMYWRGCLLDPASAGLLNVLGLLSVRDLLYYLQFYSLPILSLIVLPVLKLCATCITVHAASQPTDITARCWQSMDSRYRRIKTGLLIYLKLLRQTSTRS